MSFDDVYLPSSANRSGGASTADARCASARAAAAIGVAGPLAVAALLPDPRRQLALLADPRDDVVVGAVATLVATAIVYLLLAWAAAIVLAALAGRAPGALGRAARRTLIHITPAVARQLVVTAAGLSLATGLAACGGHAIAPPSTTSPPAAVQQQVTPPLAWQRVQTIAFAPDSTRAKTAGVPAARAGSDPVTPPAPSGVTSEVTVDLDWPLTYPAPTSTAPAARPSADPTTPAPVAETTAEARTTAGATAQPASATRGQETPPQPVQAPPAKRRPADAGGDVVVHRGDSLWSIAAARLPPDAGAAQIDSAWRAWYRENRDIIGADPGLILPGQRLHAPPGHIAHDESGGTTHGSAQPHLGGLR